MIINDFLYKTCKKMRFSISLVFVFCALLSGCASMHEEHLENYQALFDAGDYAAASAVYPAVMTEDNEDSGDNEGKKAKLPYLPALNTATASLMAKEHKKADDYFELSSADIKTENTDGYNPKYYEKIMLNTYSGLNAWQNKKTADARVDFNRAYAAQQRAVQENQKAIREIEEKANKEKAQENIKEANKKIESLYENFKDLEAYKDFANPYASYLGGLFLVLNRQTPSDIENGINYLKRVVSMMPDNQYIKQDLLMANEIASGKASPSKVWVIYEQGLAYMLEKERFSIPLYFGSGIKFATVAFPKLLPRDAAYEELEITYKDKILKTALLADIDKVIASEYYERLPYEITKTVLWAVANLVAQEALQRSSKNDGSAFGAIAALVVSQITNPVETDTWTSLSKKVALASFEMPQDKTITLSAGNYMIAKDIVFKKNTKYAIVYVRVPTKGAKPAVIVSEFK